MARPVPAEHLPAGAVCALTTDGRLGARERQAIEWFAEFLAAHKAATTDAERAAALAECNARFDGAAESQPAYVPEPPPDPADYCGECGQPLTRCHAWNYGDHRESDLL